MISSKFDNRYNIVNKLGEGSYGCVYEAIDTHLNKQVVLKIGVTKNSLRNEANVYSMLHKNWSPTGIPKVYTYAEGRREYIVMEKLGKSLRYFWNHCGNKFSLKTLVMLGTQMVSRLESVHNRGFVHGDIKDDNFVMGDGKSATLYIIDFGLSKTYVDMHNGQHLAEEYDANVLGTIFYASVNTHNKIRLSRRDDIESLAYMMIRMLKGRLPWEESPAYGGNFHQYFERAGRTKQSTSVSTVCSGLPDQIKQFLRYARRLTFSERPNYSFLRELLRKVLLKANLCNDGVYDWMVGGSV